MGKKHHKKNHISLIEKILLGNSIYEAMTIFPGKRADEVGRMLMGKLVKELMLTLILLIIPAIAVLLLYSRKGEDDPLRLVRNNFNGADKKIQIHLKEGEQNEVVSVRLAPIELSDEEIDLIQKSVEETLDRIVLSENASFDEIEKDLFFPDELSSCPVKISWSTDNFRLVNYKGEVMNDELTEKEDIVICAKVSYGKEFRLYERCGTVVPRRLSEEELRIREATSKIQESESSTRGNSEFLLPAYVDGFEVVPEDRRSVPGWVGAAVLLLVGPVATVAGFRNKIGEDKKRRIKLAEQDYRDFISKLILFLSAGMALRPAWIRLADDYCNAEKNSLLAGSLAVSKREMETGMPEREVFEVFAERMETVMYKRLTALLIRADTKGVNDLCELLESELSEMSAGEKEKIVIRGENAGTKLLMPMMGLLVVVFAIILVPAFMSM